MKGNDVNRKVTFQVIVVLSIGETEFIHLTAGNIVWPSNLAVLC